MDCTKIKLRVFLALKKILIPIKMIKIKLQSILVTPFIKKYLVSNFYYLQGITSYLLLSLRLLKCASSTLEVFS